MSATDYLSFLPLLIYGIAIADLLSEWKRLFEKKEFFLPYALFTVMLTEVAIYNVFIYAELIKDLEGLRYGQYLIYLLPPFLFMMVANVFTPDKGEDTRLYFIKQRPLFFSLVSVFMATHFLFDFNEAPNLVYIRLIYIAIFFVVGFIKKIWPTYVVFALWLISIFIREGVMASI
jgi:hypothetical protein